MGSLSVFLWTTEPNLDRTETDNLGTIRLWTRDVGLHPLRGIKKIGLVNTIDEGKSHDWREVGAGV